MSASYPSAPLFALDTVWFQVAGTLCNLHCTHCFISCSPVNKAFGMMSLAQIEGYLREAEELGARDYAFTGGEPFLNKEIFSILEAALARGPVTVLTNGLLLDRQRCERLRALSDASPYSLDIRVSLDGYDAATNDAVRGAGTFQRVVAALLRLADAGLNPVVTTAEVADELGSQAGRRKFLEFLRETGLTKPRLKILPLLHLGAETARTRAYAAWESLRGKTLTDAEADALQCGTSRMVTDRGVHVCPLLIDFPGSLMAPTLRGSMRPFELKYPACFSCHATGFSCRT